MLGQSDEHLVEKGYCGDVVLEHMPQASRVLEGKNGILRFEVEGTLLEPGLRLGIVMLVLDTLKLAMCWANTQQFNTSLVNSSKCARSMSLYAFGS